MNKKKIERKNPKDIKKKNFGKTRRPRQRLKHRGEMAGVTEAVLE